MGGPDVAALPIVGPLLEPQPAQQSPKYVSSIGTPAAVTLPETDFATWFPEKPRTDPYETPFWTVVDKVTGNASTSGGWAEVCKKVSTATGADRTAKQKLGALACSDDPTVTQLQRLVVLVLNAQAGLALSVKGVPEFGLGTLQGRQGEIRVICIIETARLGVDSAVAQACGKALDLSYLAGKPADTFTSLGEAYTLLATAVATQSPKTAAEPATFEAKK